MAHSLLLFALLVCMPFAHSTGADAWELLYEHDGVRVSRQDTSPPTFRAEGVVAGNVFEVLAVLADTGRWTEWIRNLERTRIVEGEPETRMVLHNRFDLPWPTRDRDSVLVSITDSDYAIREVTVTFHTVMHPAVSEDPDYIRIPMTRGRFQVRDVDGKSVFLSYTVAIDAGGWLPQWLSELLVRRIPQRTLAALQEQLAATAGDYQDFIELHRRKAAAAAGD